MSEKALVKAMFPDGVETITITKSDYDRLYGDMTSENIELKKEINKLNDKIKMAVDYIENAEGNDINYIATLLLGYPVEIKEMREQVLMAIGSENND